LRPDPLNGHSRSVDFFSPASGVPHDPLMTARIRLGDLLVASNVVTESQLAEALAKQKETGRRLGETLVAMGYVTELQVAQTLSHQLSVPWVNLLHVDFSRELLNLVSADVAVASRVVPVYVRRVRQQGDVLFVATDDPLNEQALLAVAGHVGMPVKAMVASALDLRNALRVYYGRVVAAPEPLAPAPPPDAELEIEVDVPVSVVHSLRPAAAAPREAPSEPAPIPATRVKPKPKDEPTSKEEPATAPVALVQAKPKPSVPGSEGFKAEPSPEASPSAAAAAAPAEEVREEPRPRKKRSAPSRPRMLTLTLLDGTQVKLPAPTPQTEETSAEHHLTSRDLIQALLLHAEGKDVSAVLRDAHWETLFAALLSILLKKGLVADWEFVEEWTKMRRQKGQ
jgi:type IV pilus assembly protein PilB